MAQHGKRNARCRTGNNPPLPGVVNAVYDNDIYGSTSSPLLGGCDSVALRFTMRLNRVKAPVTERRNLNKTEYQGVSFGAVQTGLEAEDKSGLEGRWLKNKHH